MNITANTPRPQPPKKERRNYLSWIIFLLILARPLWGILRSVVGPRISDQQLLMFVVGVVAVGIVFAIAVRARDSGAPNTRIPSSTGSSPPRIPSSAGPSSPRLPTSTGPSRPPLPTSPYTPGTGLPIGPPRFEPIITGKVLLAGMVLAALMGGFFVLLWLG